MRHAIESRQNTARPLPLVGRQRELRELIAALRMGQPRLILGPAGIGKKRLVEEALQAAERPFVRVRAAGVLHELLAELAAALGCAHSRFPSLPKATSPALKGLVLNALRRAPQCVVLEDLHDADPRMYRFLQRLYYIPGVSLIVTATSRADLGFVRKLLWDPCEEILIGPLSRNEAQWLFDEAARAFAIESLKIDDFGRKVLAAAKGNPGQILAMCRMAARPEYQRGRYIKFLPLRMDMLSAFLS
jgi:predicted ATPase